MHPRTRELLDYLETQRAILRAAFDAVPPDARDRTPAPGQWSPAAIVEHLAIVDGRIAQLLTTKIAEGRKNGVGPETSADPILPTLAVERVVDRTIRTEAPERLHPSGLDASAAWDALERSTVSLRDAVAACDGLALSTLTHPHPLLGPLSLYHWIAFAGAHEARHAAQIRETSTQRTQRTQRKRITLVSFVSFVLMASLSAQRSAGPVGIRVLSTRADRVSGGDVLVAIAAPASAKAPPIVLLNGRDISSSFHADHGSFVGLVTGLAIGRNQLKVTADPEGREQTLEVTNYPIHGPIISGPHQDPFVCQTDTFKLPDGTTLGAPADANCSAPTKIQYVYMPKDGKEFKPLANTRALPDDVATTTTLSGRSVPFVVRVETGTMNRGIYQNVVLHDPAHDPAPTPFTPPPAWNRRLIALHGTGCPGGWYRQGGVMGVNPLAGASIARLGEGYAIFTNTLNHPTNSCNPFLAGETTMMGKEHAIETFGVPDFTVSMGSSGGAYTSLQIADEFPGLFDGILINATFPDALSIALAGSDARLLAHYVEVTDPSALTDAQQIAVGGYSGLKAFADAANQSQRTDPVPGRIDRAGYNSAVWNAIVPANARYDPKTNPKGARPTVFDAARNIYGVDPKTGFARRPFDNVGVQYGLAALNAGVITTKQFLDLNEKIGGFDDDANYSASRSSGDAGAIRRAYQAGVTLGGGGGLASIPVFDDGAYNDAGGYHYQWFHFAIRERIAAQNGNADNHVMWRGPVQAAPAWEVFVKWVATGQKPAEAVDGCWIAEPGKPAEFVAEHQTFGSKPDSTCNRAYPSYSFARRVAGGPLDANTLKCQLKSIVAKDYAVPLTSSELDRLRNIFPGGVCDWSKRGSNQMRVVPWASFGPAPENFISNR